jgi:hypothetical protein
MVSHPSYVDANTAPASQIRTSASWAQRPAKQPPNKEIGLGLSSSSNLPRSLSRRSYSRYSPGGPVPTCTLPRRQQAFPDPWFSNAIENESLIRLHRARDRNSRPQHFHCDGKGSARFGASEVLILGTPTTMQSPRFREEFATYGVKSGRPAGRGRESHDWRDSWGFATW